MKKISSLDDKDISTITDPAQSITFENVDNMIENAIGTFSLPLGIATNFIINGKEYLVPMAIEEPSVIAAASKAAKIARTKGGFIANASESIMIGQIQVVPGSNPEFSLKDASKRILENREILLRKANSKSRSIVATDIQVRQIKDSSQNNLGDMLVTELIIDTRDAMGANVINTMCEAVAPDIEEITQGKVILKILSNFATSRLVHCRAVFAKQELGGDTIVDRILYAYALAHSDVYRAVTHNKGVMNGIDAVAIATGQDFRAIEAAAHAYSARTGQYRSLTNWHKTPEGDLVGEIEMPMAVGIIGGVVSVHPTAKIALKILNIQSAKELAMIIAAAGLAQNLGALRALAAEGIQSGHMRLHARNIAVMAGAKGSDIDRVAKIIADEKQINIKRAKEIVSQLEKE